MRWLFLFVFALNLAYIGWGLNQPPADPYANVKPLKNVTAIVLLSELDSEGQSSGRAEARSVTAVVAGPSEKVEVETVPVEVVDAVEVQASPPVEEPVTAPELSPQPAAVKVIAADTKVDNVETSVSDAGGEPAGEALAPNTKPSAVTVKPGVMPSSESSLAQVSPGCYTLGPFRDLGKLRGLIREIKSFVVSADFRGKEEKEQSLYWVYIKPEKNRQQAIKTGRRLKAKKIKDFYIIREGEKINGLSLGYFRSKSGATGLVKKVDKLGFDVVLEPVFKTYTLYWLDYQLKDGAEMPASVFEKYIAGGKKDKVSLVSRDCDN